MAARFCGMPRVMAGADDVLDGERNEAATFSSLASGCRRLLPAQRGAGLRRATPGRSGYFVCHRPCGSRDSMCPLLEGRSHGLRVALDGLAESFGVSCFGMHGHDGRYGQAQGDNEPRDGAAQAAHPSVPAIEVQADRASLPLAGKFARFGSFFIHTPCRLSVPDRSLHEWPEVSRRQIVVDCRQAGRRYYFAALKSPPCLGPSVEHPTERRQYVNSSRSLTS